MVAGSATLRAWAPAAEHVYIVVDGQDPYTPDDGDELLRGANGTGTGFRASLRNGTQCRFSVDGPRGRGLKRDPWARELEAGDYLSRDGIVRDPEASHPARHRHDRCSSGGSATRTGSRLQLSATLRC